MSPWKKTLIASVLSTVSFTSYADSLPVDDFIAISAYLGGRYSEDFSVDEADQSAEIATSFAQAIALSWYYGRNTEGELLYSNSKQNVTISGENQQTTDLYTSYLHFGGRVNFVDNGPFSTSLGLGVGATFLVPDDSMYDNEIALSGNITGGMRYELNDQWALKADLRFYGTVIKNNSSLFCGDGKCLIQLEGEVYVQTELMAGVEYKF
ncbi:hypothetical protein CW745_03970 [Psychromonas sp. psych-6C06]|uniref:outer membrane beta-barrel protein n=1 Tax=Psychromonas sp. psych-6C06 TaxID=2058089 RepID=UPI000C32127C|nr:outer membrane beta-barrel protein [Psychromonas sp. psych-6C06]PKF62587.1 hypothetical protein CW745_03970 [Psychromonas sp. psych-6C06]